MVTFPQAVPLPMSTLPMQLAGCRDCSLPLPGGRGVPLVAVIAAKATFSSMGFAGFCFVW